MYEIYPQIKTNKDVKTPPIIVFTSKPKNSFINFGKFFVLNIYSFLTSSFGTGIAAAALGFIVLLENKLF